jgi:hypothetical protein
MLFFFLFKIPTYKGTNKSETILRTQKEVLWIDYMDICLELLHFPSNQSPCYSIHHRPNRPEEKHNIRHREASVNIMLRIHGTSSGGLGIVKGYNVYIRSVTHFMITLVS